jgi:hypothetical protein
MFTYDFKFVSQYQLEILIYHILSLWEYGILVIMIIVTIIKFDTVILLGTHTIPRHSHILRHFIS